jgi:signal transduction histidine kinase
MLHLFHWLFSTDEFMPHGMCYEWNPYVIWLNVVSDALITIAYYSIPLTLVYFVTRRKDLVFDWIFLSFAIFIVACGTTHLLEIINVWHPAYWLTGLVKAITAIVSIGTAILLMRLVPQALALRGPDEWRRINADLERQIDERNAAAERVTALNAELQSQSHQLASINKELEAFAYSVSHDLRAPLRHIDGYIGLLKVQAPALGDDSHRYLDVVSDSARQMGRLIDNLLEFSRMGRADLNKSWVESSDLVAAVRQELGPDTANREIEWNVAPLPRVLADPILLKQVWMNLLGNAVKYTRDRRPARITIACEERPDFIEFRVEDNGAGFDMEYVEKLFGIFQRLHFKEEFEGNGIGLANARRIVARHGGRIWAEGAVNVGATFHFTLPKAPSP